MYSVIIFFQGNSCEKCSIGYFGDATQGSANDCLPCPCHEPRVETPSCARLNESDVSSMIVCDDCKQGYVGPLCKE